MPRESQPERGQRGSHQTRYRLTAGPCRGLDLSADRSTLADESLVEATNVRVHDGIVVCRGGQSAVVDSESALSGCIMGMIDLQGVGVSLILNPAGQLDTYVENLATADQYERVTDEVTEQTLLRVHPTNTSRGRYSYAHWKGSIVLFGEDPTGSAYSLYKLIPPDLGNDATDIKIEEIFSLPSGVTPSSIVVFPATQGSGESPEMEPIFIGTQQGGVYAYDGVEVAEVRAAGHFSSRVIVFKYNDILYAAGTQQIERWLAWNRGTSAPFVGTWQSVTLPAAAFPSGVSSFIPTCAAEYMGVCLVGGWDSNESASAGNPGPAIILQIEENPGGASVTCTVAHAVTNADYVYDCCVFNGTFTYASSWDSSFATSTGKLGGWDGSTWDEELGNMTAENEVTVFRLYPLGDRLYMGAVCEEGHSGGEAAGLYLVTPASLTPLAGLNIELVYDTEGVFSDAEGASDIAAW